MTNQDSQLLNRQYLIVSKRKTLTIQWIYLFQQMFINKDRVKQRDLKITFTECFKSQSMVKYLIKFSRISIETQLEHLKTSIN